MILEKLKLYTDVGIIPEANSHTYLLFPMFGNYLITTSDPDSNRFDEYCSLANNYFELVEDPSNSDYFLLPFGFSFNVNYQQRMTVFLEKAKQYNKKTIIFYNSDDDTDIELDNVIIFRTSYNKSKQTKNTFGLPGWSLDFVNYFPNKTFSVIPYTSTPTVSYCGYIDDKPKTLKELVKAIVKNEPLTHELMAKRIRGTACRTIQANRSIQSDFIIRNGFWAHGIDDKYKARLEYAENLINSLYGIVTRGGGNFSYRLFEILSCGRIPVFINTDSILPFDSIINWKEHVVWVEEKDLKKIDRLILDFHMSKTEDQLIKIQKSNRKLYLEYLSPNGFFKNLHLVL